MDNKYYDYQSILNINFNSGNQPSPFLLTRLHILVYTHAGT